MIEKYKFFLFTIQYPQAINFCYTEKESCFLLEKWLKIISVKADQHNMCSFNTSTDRTKLS